ncbi:hypothetical protein P8452_60024 [Trifolium repens]|nr:hypothetical protein P8452_60024 [Trifolium repens]
MPRVVSIGPRFIGREDLLPMEEVKLRCMLSLLHRGSKSLQECGEVVCKFVEEVRACYAPDIVEIEMLPSLDLAKIMLVDGCFLLELLISKGLDSHLLSSLPTRGSTSEMINNNDVLSDLMLFENQIPICVLYELSRTIFQEAFGPDAKMWREIGSAEKINILILNLLGYNPLHPLHFRYPKTPHILDLVYFFVNRRGGDRTKMRNLEENHVVVDIIDDTQTRPQQQLKLKRCALRLLTAGVTIKVTLPGDNHSTGFGVLFLASVWCGTVYIVFYFGSAMSLL